MCTEFGVLLDGDKPFRPIDDLGEVPYAELISSVSFPIFCMSV